MKRLFFLVILVCLMTGCQIQTDSSKKQKDLEFTIIEESKVPERLSLELEEKKQEPFKLTYADQGSLYLCAGYGEQKTGGYSIRVEDLYVTENAIYFDVTLLGPSAGETITEVCSYPYIVVQTEDLGLPVVFQ